MELKLVVTGLLLFIGSFFIIVSAIGIVRFPDFYSRIHAAGKCDTFGQAAILMGLMVYEGFSLVSLKLLIIVVFIFVINPTATHALANAAYITGLKPWKKSDEKKEEGA